ncbi:DUF2321 domain-containing protein [Halorubrum ezzemoulense]|uniref:DUF2321 domain-containing protein n=1 Tax=Halorubrum ezzemoulense TaxID=337243 RepID=A0ABT4Z1E3_HALEZ|nr:DUF2321 domain-containing protein [Halorubrum ezzemoulense]MDB2244520.1 DUF2321 domain-containing protein [Halorubrum ezzemoulense]MDB2278723.1 DUF2321 domain-containing protein [Halorubrum ezzemoulense]MDB2285785.1 DUF2321 domain-containing protein [Halorubrum ezzemoulense]MDB2287854.1 DUF2321 domain-containing protein [Halorubrum ezzemoulense]MDB2291979.1 DUF2321 domain-containing protein [Halorubrum ezzemoulense]
MTTYAQVCLNGHILNTSPNPEYIREHDFCEDCGQEGITECPECEDQKIIASDQNVTTDDVTRSDLDLFCRSCGTGFPWTGENGIIIREGVFVDDDYVSGTFDRQTVEEINRCYRIGANSAVLVLYRKLLENTIIEILRGHYGTDSIEKFFDTENNQFHRFSVLVSELESSKSDLGQYSDNLTSSLIARIWEFKGDGDAMAHSIKYEVNDDELEGMSSEAAHVANVLLEARNEVQRAN